MYSTIPSLSSQQNKEIHLVPNHPFIARTDEAKIQGVGSTGVCYMYQVGDLCSHADMNSLKSFRPR